MKKIISIILALCLMCSFAMPLTVVAGNETANVVESGAEGSVSDAFNLVEYIVEWLKSIANSFKLFIHRFQSHDYVTMNDKNQHWKVCSVCDKKIDQAAHDFVITSVKEPTDTEKGQIVYDCKGCAYTKTEESSIAHAE